MVRGGVQDGVGQPHDTVGVMLELGAFILVRVEVMRLKVTVDDGV